MSAIRTETQFFLAVLCQFNPSSVKVDMIWQLKNSLKVHLDGHISRTFAKNSLRRPTVAWIYHFTTVGSFSAVITTDMHDVIYLKRDKV